jgi:glutamyl-tRNA reductase
MDFGIIGTSIWQQNMPLLERLTIDRDERPAFLDKLKKDLGFDELIYLATCNRVEFIYVVSDNSAGRSRLLHGLIDHFFRDGRKLSFFPNDFYHFTGKEAMCHLFRMVASLESLVLGETQIAGQFKQAYQESVEMGMVGPALESLAQEALTVARRVKRDTTLGEGSLSMASLASRELQTRLGNVGQPVVAIVGSGTMTLKLSRYIRKSMNARLVFVNRTVSKVERFAEEFDGDTMSLDDFRENPGQVDAVVSATAAKGPVFERPFLEKLNALDKPVICIDLAIPRDFSVDFIGHDRVEVIDIPRLKSQGQGNLRQKFIEASKANDIVRDAVNKYLSGRVEVSLKPIFHNSYKESMELAEKTLDELFDQLNNLGDGEREAIRRMVNKLVGHSSFQSVRRLSDHLVEVRSQMVLADLVKARKEAV